MVKDVSEVFLSYLASNRGPDLDGNERTTTPEYGVSATLASNGVIDLTWTFRSGRPYCCDGWHCHLGLFDGERWTRLRQVATSQNVELPPLLTIHGTFIIEEGALFYDLSQPEAERVRRTFKATSSSYEYLDEAYEGDRESPY